MDEDRVLAALERLELGQRNTTERLQRMDERLDRIDERLDRIDERYHRSDERLVQFRVAVMDRFETMEDRLTRMLDDIGVNMGAVTHVRQRQDHDREEMRTLHNLVMAFDMKIQRIQTDIEELQKKAS